MDWQYMLFIFPLLIAAAISTGIALYAWQRRPAMAVVPFVGLMLAVAVWSLGYALELAGGSLQVKLFWAKIQYLGIVAIPLAWLLFALQYTGRDRWLAPRNLVFLAVVPITTLLLLWIVDVQGLIWREFAVDSSRSVSFLVLTYGPWFWVHTAYSYLLLLSGTLILILAFFRAPNVYRRQMRLMVLAALIPWLTNALVLLSRTGPLPYLALDLTPFGFVATGLVMVWGLYRFRLLELVPVAREAIIESMGDAVLVLNAQDRVVDLNPAAQDLLQLSASEAIGKQASRIFSAHPELARFCQEVTEGQAEVTLGEGDEQRSYDVDLLSLRDRPNRLTGRLVVLHDVTERKRAEAAQRQAAAETLQATRALQDKEQFLQGLFDAIQDGISTLELDYTISSANKWMEKMYAARMPLVGRKCYEVYQQRESVCPWCPCAIAIETAQAHSAIVPYPSAEAPEGWIELSAFPLKDAEGRVTGLIEYVKDITKRVQTEQALQQRTEQMEALREMGLELATQLDPESLLQSIVSRAVELLGGAFGSLFLYQPDQDLLELTVATGIDSEMVGTSLKPGEGLAGKVWDRCEPITIGDYEEWEGRAKAYGGYGFRATIGVPVRWGAESLGVLSVHALAPGVFTAKEAELLSLFATQAAIAIQNARLFQAERNQREQAEALRIQSRRHNRELALLNHVIIASAVGQEIESILQMICRELALILDVPHTAAVLLNEEKTDAVLVAGHQDGSHPAVIGLAITTAGNPAAQYLFERKETLLSEHAQSDPRLELLHDLLRERQIGSLALVPLIVEGEGVGALALGAVAPHTFSSEDVALAQRVAEQASGALARARLVRTQRRLSAAVEHSVEAVVITSEDARILYANPAFERIVGRDRETFIGKSLSTFGSERLMDPSHPDMWQTIRSGNTWQGRLEYLGADDHPLTLDLTVAPVRDQTGEIVNFVATMRDMSREIQLEKQFHQAQKMEALGRLAGGVAHDFNNLLTVIRLSTHMLQRELDPDGPLWTHTEQIQETSDRAARLTKQLLSFSRRDVVEPKILDLSDIISDLSPMLERVIGEEIELKTELADDLWPVKADLSQMDQVIINLAVNARDAMPDGGTLAFETANVELDEAYAALHMDVRPGEYARLTITDTGTGMDAEVQAHLFEPFFTTKRPGEGTGLGLATVFGIIRFAGGHIRVSSRVGQGTAIHIYMPRTMEIGLQAMARPPLSVAHLLAAGPGAAEAGAPLSLVKGAPPGASRDLKHVKGTETVLVVEDEDTVRDQAVLVLKSYGYHVLAAGDGTQALEISGDYEGPIHLLLTDVIMPRMNGRELAEQLQPIRPETRVLYMSGYTGDVLAPYGVLAEGVAFLPKPFSLAALTGKVRETLDTRREQMPAG